MYLFENVFLSLTTLNDIGKKDHLNGKEWIHLFEDAIVLLTRWVVDLKPLGKSI